MNIMHFRLQLGSCPVRAQSLGRGCGWGVRASGSGVGLLTPQNWIRDLISQIERCFCKGGLIQTQCPDHSAAGVSVGAFWLKWPKVRGCDVKAARNSPLGTSFSSFISHPKLKIMAENFVLHLYSLFPLSSFFCLITGSSFHQERSNGKTMAREK